MAEAEENFLTVLRAKSRTRLQKLHLAHTAGLHDDPRPYRITVAFAPAQAERDSTSDPLRDVTQYAKLRPGAVLQKNLQPPIVVKIRQREGPAVVNKIESDRSCCFRECAIAVIRVKSVPLVAGPCAV